MPAWAWLHAVCQREPRQFAHWGLLHPSDIDPWEPDDGWLSRPVLRVMWLIRGHTTDLRKCRCVETVRPHQK
jgi:hypothetical protein